MPGARRSRTLDARRDRGARIEPRDERGARRREIDRHDRRGRRGRGAEVAEHRHGRRAKLLRGRRRRGSRLQAAHPHGAPPVRDAVAETGRRRHRHRRRRGRRRAQRAGVHARQQRRRRRRRRAGRCLAAPPRDRAERPRDAPELPVQNTGADRARRQGGRDRRGRCCSGAHARMHRRRQLHDAFVAGCRHVAYVDAHRRFAGELREPQPLVDRANPIELLPRRRHQRLLLRLHDLRAEPGGDTGARVGVQLLEPRRRLPRLERRARGMPPAVERRRDHPQRVRLIEQRRRRVQQLGERLHELSVRRLGPRARHRRQRLQRPFERERLQGGGRQAGAWMRHVHVARAHRRRQHARLQLPDEVLEVSARARLEPPLVIDGQLDVRRAVAPGRGETVHAVWNVVAGAREAPALERGHQKCRVRHLRIEAPRREHPRHDALRRRGEQRVHVSRGDRLRPAHLRVRPRPALIQPRQGGGARHGHARQHPRRRRRRGRRDLVVSKRDQAQPRTQAIASGRLGRRVAPGEIGFAELDQRKVIRLGVVHRGARPHAAHRLRVERADVAWAGEHQGRRGAQRPLVEGDRDPRRGPRRGRTGEILAIDRRPEPPAQPRQKRVRSGQIAHGVVASSDAGTTCSCPRSSGCAFR